MRGRDASREPRGWAPVSVCVCVCVCYVAHLLPLVELLLDGLERSLPRAHHLVVDRPLSRDLGGVGVGGGGEGYG